MLRTTLPPMFYNLHFRNLRGDFFGGLTTAVIALPLSLAFGIASGLGAMAGLYSAIFLGFFAALFGGSPAQVSGPNGPMTVVMATAVASFLGNPAMCFAAVILAGIMQIAIAGLRLGKYIALVPYPVISGFMSGVGAIIIILQLATISGHSSFANIGHVISMMPSYWENANIHAIYLGIISLSIMIFTPRKIDAVVPAPLIALAIGTLCALEFFNAAPQIGQIPSGFPVLLIPDIGIEEIPILLMPALMLALLGSLDSLMTATVADSMTDTYHKPNKELFGQGIGNIMSGLFGGIAGSGATMRTSVNIRAGGRTPISGAFHSMILLAVVLGLAPLVANIPHAVLGGILLKVGFDIIDWHFIKKFRTAPIFKVMLMLLVVMLTVTLDLMTAVIIGVFLSSLHLIKNLADVQLSAMHPVDATASASVNKTDITTQAMFKKYRDEILLYRLSGPLSFGAASGMVQKFSAIDFQKALFLDFSDVTYADISSALAIEDIVEKMQSRKKMIYLIGLQPHVEDILKRVNVLQAMPENRICRNLHSALANFEQERNNLPTFS